MLILDEAHHLKNDQTDLAKLFRDSSNAKLIRDSTKDDMAILAGKFQRMLFLTATPFQLGHEELIRVLQSFKAVRWGNADSPAGDEQQFDGSIATLAKALDANRHAGRHLDRLWGKVHSEMLGAHDVEQWWRRVEAAPADDAERRLVEAVRECRTTRDDAQKLLWPWLIRHNRPTKMASREGQAAIERRVAVVGRAILSAADDQIGGEAGLPITKETSLPFPFDRARSGRVIAVFRRASLFCGGAGVFL